jgi:hypothetical protein
MRLPKKLFYHKNADKSAKCIQGANTSSKQRSDAIGGIGMKEMPKSQPKTQYN